MTSGLGGVYPKGLRLGLIAEIEPATGQLTQIAIVRPAVDLGRLEQVFVMMRRGATMELLYRSNAPEDDLPGPGHVASGPPPETVSGRRVESEEGGTVEDVPAGAAP